MILTKLYKEYYLELKDSTHYRTLDAGVSKEQTLSYVKYVLKNPKVCKVIAKHALGLDTL